MELARGTIADRPWGQTIGALGMRGLTGQLTLASEGKQYCVAFRQGAVIGATSPLPNDATVRVALTAGLISSTQAADISRRIAATPNRDDLEVLAEHIRLTPDQTQRLRRRMIAQRAARTFSIERGEFVVHDEVTIPTLPGCELDIRAVIYLGAKNNLREDRLTTEVSQLGAWFKLKAEAVADLVQFGFTEIEKPILQLLVEGANVVDLEISNSELGPRGVRAILYALGVIGACETSATTRGETKRPSTPPPARVPQPGGARTTTRTGTPMSPRTTPPGGLAAMPVRGQPQSTAPPEATPSRARVVPAASVQPPVRDGDAPEGMRIRTPTQRDATGSNPGIKREASASSPPVASTPTQRAGTSPPVARTPTQRAGTSPPVSRTPTQRERAGSSPPVTPTPTTPQPLERARPLRSQTAPALSRARKPDPAAAAETEQLIAEKVALLDAGADHYALFGIARDAGADTVRNAYFDLARKLHPDRLSSLGITDANRGAQRLFAQINSAFAVLADPERMKDYLSTLARGGEAAVRAEEAKADDLAQQVMRAEEAFRRGEMAMRRDQLAQAVDEFAQAVELQPKEPEYQALLAWAKFAAASDKVAVADATRKALMRAADASDRSVTARFYLGRVERMLGREREALANFQAVLLVKPSHAEANSEVRILEQRLKGKK